MMIGKSMAGLDITNYGWWSSICYNQYTDIREDNSQYIWRNDIL